MLHDMKMVTIDGHEVPEFGITRENEERRDGGCAVIFDPQRQKYAVYLRPNGSMGFFAGGVEDGEDIVAGIMREVEEESGLHQFSHVEHVCAAYAHYHNSAKNVHRVALAHCLLGILGSTDKKTQKLEGHEDFSVAFVTPDELIANWNETRAPEDVAHWRYFFAQAVARTIELGLDTTYRPRAVERLMPPESLA